MAGLIGKTKKPKHGLLRPKIKLFLICIDRKRITLLIRLTTVPVRQSHTIVSSLLWTLQAFILNLSPALEESAGHTVPVPLEKCRFFLEKNGEKWPALRKITAAKSHDFVAVGTPGRIWTSDPSLRSSPVSLPSKSIKVKESQYFQGFPALPSQSKQAKINQNQLEKTGQN